MKPKGSKRVAGIVIRSRKSIVKDGVVTVSSRRFVFPSFDLFILVAKKQFFLEGYRQNMGVCSYVRGITEFFVRIS